MSEWRGTKLKKLILKRHLKKKMQLAEPKENSGLYFCSKEEWYVKSGLHVDFGQHNVGPIQYM